MTSSRGRVVALGAWLLGGAIGWQTATADYERPRSGVIGLPPWTVGGAALGMTRVDAERILGAPTGSQTSDGRTTATWRGISITFDAGGRAVEVLGDRLTSPHGATLLARGASESDVVAQIGAGRGGRGTSTPSGSGLISCGRAGGTRSYEDATTRYELSIYEDRLASVRLRPRPQ